MKQRFVKILSAFMFVVFLYGTTPPEYLHDLFTHHQDTIDGVYKKGEFHISKQHTHCAFLGISFGHYLAAEKIHYFFESISHTSKWVLPIHRLYLSSFSHFSYLRGPPPSIS